jgi:hypothetical protein
MLIVFLAFRIKKGRAIDVFQHLVVFERNDDPDHNGDEFDDQDFVRCGKVTIFHYNFSQKGHWPSLLLLLLDTWKLGETVPDFNFLAQTLQFHSSSKKRHLFITSVTEG